MQYAKTFTPPRVTRDELINKAFSAFDGELNKIARIINRTPLLDVRDYGETFGFPKAIDRIGSESAVLLIPNEQKATDNITIPTNVTLWPLQGSSLNISSGKTVTINGNFEAGLFRVFTGDGDVSFGRCEEIRVMWFGADPTYATDSTTAFQKAFSSVTATAEKVTMNEGQFDVRGKITVKGRTHFKGKGLRSAIYFNPTSNDTNLFEDDAGGTDNVKFEGFQVYNNDSNSKTGQSAFYISSNANAYTWDRVYIQGFYKYGIYHDSAMYDVITRCRFLDMDNSADGSSLAKAVCMPTFANAVTIEKSRFANNDRSIEILNGGYAVNIEKNSFERDGDSGNAAGIADLLRLYSIRALNIKGNYFEGEETGTGDAVIFLNGCISPVIEGNFFAGDYGGTTYSDYFIQNVDCHDLVVRNNTFMEILTVFLTTNVKTKMHDNYYYDGGAEITGYNSIMAKMGGSNYIELSEHVEDTWNPGSIADGDEEAKEITVTGARLGDWVIASFSLDVADLVLTAQVSANDTVTCVLANNTGGAIDLAEGTVYVKVIKK